MLNKLKNEVNEVFLYATLAFKKHMSLLWWNFLHWLLIELWREVWLLFKMQDSQDKDWVLHPPFFPPWNDTLSDSQNYFIATIF